LYGNSVPRYTDKCTQYLGNTVSSLKEVSLPGERLLDDLKLGSDKLLIPSNLTGLKDNRGPYLFKQGKL
jgi:hypothetical protein